MKRLTTFSLDFYPQVDDFLAQGVTVDAEDLRRTNLIPTSLLERQLNQWPLDSFDHQGVKVIEIHVTGSAEVILEFVADNLFEGQLIHVQVSAPGFVLQSKILGKQNGAGGEHGGPDERVLQLANVARPRVLFQKFLRFRRNAGGLDAHFAVDLVDEVADQEWDI